MLDICGCSQAVEHTHLGMFVRDSSQHFTRDGFVFHHEGGSGGEIVKRLQGHVYIGQLPATGAGVNVDKRVHLNGTVTGTTCCITTGEI